MRSWLMTRGYGVSDDLLPETIFSERAPGGRLQFELPSSEAAVGAQLTDVPDDSARPLFTRGSPSRSWLTGLSRRLTVGPGLDDPQMGHAWG